MLATPEERRKMGEEDVAFALAVLRYDFTGQLAAMARNTVRQLTYIDYDGLNQNCFARPNCWRALPQSQREKLRHTPSGQGLWPERFMNGLLYTVVLGSLAILAVLGPSIARQDPERWRLLRTWLLVGFAAMFVCAFFGGAVAEPQYRYQGRLIWLVPFMAGVSLLIHLQLKRRHASEPVAIT